MIDQFQLQRKTESAAHAPLIKKRAAAMACFLDMEARESERDRIATGEVEAEDGYLSEEVPFQTPSRSQQNLRLRRYLIVSSDTDSSGDNDEEEGLLGLSKRKRPGTTNDDNILEELKKNNSLIVCLVKKMKRTEQRIKAIEERNESSSKKVVPDAVRVNIV